VKSSSWKRKSIGFPTTIPDDHAFPATSDILPTNLLQTPANLVEQDEEPSTSALGTPRYLTKPQLEAFKQTLPSAVQIQLDQPFGKDSLSHSFTSDVRFPHVLV
jgi:hypothetical protein